MILNVWTRMSFSASSKSHGYIFCMIKVDVASIQILIGSRIIFRKGHETKVFNIWTIIVHMFSEYVICHMNYICSYIKYLYHEKPPLSFNVKVHQPPLLQGQNTCITLTITIRDEREKFIFPSSSGCWWYFKPQK